MKLIQNNEIQKKQQKENYGHLWNSFLKIGGAFMNLFRERTENIEK